MLKIMTELEFLKDLKKSYQERLKDLSDIISKMKDITTKDALVNNHKNGMIEINHVNERIKQLENSI